MRPLNLPSPNLVLWPSLLKNRSNPLPFAIYFGIVVLLTVGGLADSVYLALSHYRVYTDIGYVSFCAISRAINCDTVSQSPFSILLGVPVPVWGVLGYSFFLILLPFASAKDAGQQRLWPLLFLFSAGFSLYSIVLALISTYWIHSYCVMCIVSYAVNFSLLYFTWLIMRRFAADGWWKGMRKDFHFLWCRRKRFGPIFLLFIIGYVLLAVFLPPYWVFSAPSISENQPRGITEEGHPWIGARNPELTIEEFTDYQCFQCKKMHFFLRRMVAEHPEKIRLVHRNYPLDHAVNPVVVPEPFHEGSWKMALIANAAALEGKFWEMNDLLFRQVGHTDTIKLRELAEQTGIEAQALAKNLTDPKARYLLKLDIWEGMQASLTGTPGYRINGEVYMGHIPPSILDPLLK